MLSCDSWLCGGHHLESKIRCWASCWLKFPFSPETTPGGIGLVKIVAKNGFEVVCQTGVPLAIHPNGANMAAGSGAGTDFVATRKTVYAFARNKFLGGME